MKTILHKLALVVTVLTVLTPSLTAQADAPASLSQRWDVAVMFLMSTENDDYQKDVDHNIQEIQSLIQSQLTSSTPSTIRFNILRSTPQQDLIYYQNSTLPTVSLSRDFPLQNVKPFLAQSFEDPTAHRLLILYSHGFGFRGMNLNSSQTTSLQQLKKFFTDSLMSLSPRLDPSQKPLDLLWMDSCYMGNLEAAYEFKPLTDYYLAPEDFEFSAGIPYQALAKPLLENGSVETLAKDLARSQLDSYSTYHHGSQNEAVYSNSATISVIQTENLSTLVQHLKKLTQQLQQLSSSDFDFYFERLRKWQRKRSLTASMSKSSDLGQLLIKIRNLKISPEISQTTQDALKTLELDTHAINPTPLKLIPRVELIHPAGATHFAYSYNDWTRGDEQDLDTQELIPPLLRSKKFIDIKEGSFPLKTIPQNQRRLSFAPFAPRLPTFNVLWLSNVDNRWIVLSEQTFNQTQDIFIRQALQPTNPIRLSGFTIGSSNRADRYTGLSIFDPSVDSPVPSYTFSQFILDTGWDSLAE
jgi:hypothetical protein